MRLLLIFTFFHTLAFGQTAYVVLDSISLQGNQKTRDQIIFRELEFQVGDTIAVSELPELVKISERQVLNTAMFTAVNINIKRWDTESRLIKIHITVRENWYIFPIPIFELADRNFNVWWQEQNHALDRINFGLRFYHVNFTGRRDLLKLVTQFGYTQKYELEYNLPAFNRSQTIGFKTNLFFSRNRETSYRTLENKLLFQRDEDKYLLQRLRFSMGLVYRPRIFLYHELDVECHKNKTTSLVADELNTDFFLDGRTQQQFFAIRYAFIIDKRDIKPYPLKGSYLNAELRKEGTGVFDERNALTFATTYAHYFGLGSRWNLELIGKGRISAIREKQPYYNNQALGFEADYLRGYELYVIDGLDFGYLKTSVRFELMEKEITFGKMMPFEKIKVMPLRIYLSLNGDSGFANDPFYGASNPLTNRLLWGGGLGLDIISYFDKVVQMQFSMNHLGEKGVFLHYKFIL